MAESTVLQHHAPTAADLGAVSPAAHLSDVFAAAEVTGERGVRLRELAFRTMIGLRVSLDGPAAGRVEGVLGAALPVRCGGVSTGRLGDAIWLSPDEFLLLAHDQDVELTRRLVEALAADRGAVVDLSANRTTFELAGPMARAVLEKGCPLDLHPRSFPASTAYLTTIGSVPVIVSRVAEESFQILPRSSFADFLGRWLVDAMAEFTAAEFTVAEFAGAGPA